MTPDKAPIDWNTRMKIALGAAKGLTYLHDVANSPVDCDTRAYAASIECQDTQQFSGFLKGPWNKKKQSSLHMMHNKYEQSCRYEGPQTAEALIEFVNTEGGVEPLPSCSDSFPLFRPIEADHPQILGVDDSSSDPVVAFPTLVADIRDSSETKHMSR
ncbi:hypothetical protein ZIOFF_073202 [Zingiber officinale]|uniref:Uncharacterized protein n=1 Tax=Zingiber officinale TaxID=94328 RepID=A0A8J5CSK3_ZINOF|nr:hypothetical protein ZIOFF_073202 [Zingiber officinale]